MQAQRNTAFIFLLILTMIILYTWSSDKTKENIYNNQPITTITNSSNSNVASSNTITIDTDLYHLVVSLNGGDIIRADLKDQKQNIDSDENFKLLKSNPNFTYVAKSNINLNGRPFSGSYTADKAIYQMTGDSLTVTLKAQDQQGADITKLFIFNKNKHVIDVKYIVKNITSPYKISTFSYLEQSSEDPEQSNNIFGTGAYRGIAYSTNETRYEKLALDTIAESAKNTYERSQNGGWVSMIQHYFVTAWIGNSNSQNTLVFQSANQGKNAIAGIQSSEYTINPGEEIKIGNLLWLGPKLQDEMEQTVANLELTVDYGWLWFISIYLFWIMQKIHELLLLIGIDNAMGAWGFSIILLTLLVRSVLYPLTKHQYVSMAKMRLLAPKLQALKDKYKDDKQRFTQEMMALYSRERVKPLSGCLPIFIQMPIFIALYWTFMESIELRHSPFIFWIKDLSIQDPYFVLPIFMGITMFLIQKMSPTPITDPIQKKIMNILPVVFTLMFCTFPAGLTLYWVVSNVVTIIQQYFIYKALEKRGLHVKANK